MASLYHIPTFHSLFSSKLFSPHFAPLKLHHQKILACSIKKPRASRKVKSNAELCNDIREFLSLVGLPQDHVPSMKQLSQHGRQDLAHIVRRRGYKVIGELLAPSAEKNLTGNQEEVHCGEDKSTGQNEKLKDLADDVPLTSDATMMENHTNGKETERMLNYNFTLEGSLGPIQHENMIDLFEDVSSSSNAATMELSISNLGVDGQLNTNDGSCISSEDSFYSSMQERAAQFIQDGQLDTIEDTGFGILSEKSSEDAEYSELQNALEPEYGSTSEEHTDLVVSSADGAEISNGNNMSSSKNFIIDDQIHLDDETQKSEHQADINRLKFMLHQKELELTQLKQEIEKEKLALSALQTKAEKEINKARKLISEKDAELNAAEESLSELKEVEIQYCGDGETVEVSGSFNGWHQTIKMDPTQSSIKSRLWRTTLWLYPGVYEIKFVIDGHWKIDPTRESVVSGSIHNNILRVER